MCSTEEYLIAPYMEHKTQWLTLDSIRLRQVKRAQLKQQAVLLAQIVDLKTWM